MQACFTKKAPMGLRNEEPSGRGRKAEKIFQHRGDIRQTIRRKRDAGGDFLPGIPAEKHTAIP